MCPTCRSPSIDFNMVLVISQCYLAGKWRSWIWTPVCVGPYPVPCLQPREVMWDQTLNVHGVEEWCFRGRSNLSVSEPRRERGSRKGEINAARERGDCLVGRSQGDIWQAIKTQMEEWPWKQSRCFCFRDRRDRKSEEGQRQNFQTGARRLGTLEQMISVLSGMPS